MRHGQAFFVPVFSGHSTPDTNRHPALTFVPAGHQIVKAERSKGH
jgi:hypothetical protein